MLSVAGRITRRTSWGRETQHSYVHSSARKQTSTSSQPLSSRRSRHLFWKLVVRVESGLPEQSQSLQAIRTNAQQPFNHNHSRLDITCCEQPSPARSSASLSKVSRRPETSGTRKCREVGSHQLSHLQVLGHVRGREGLIPQGYRSWPVPMVQEVHGAELRVSAKDHQPEADHQDLQPLVGCLPEVPGRCGD